MRKWISAGVRADHVDIRDTTLWLHMNNSHRAVYDHSPPVLRFQADAIAATVGRHHD